MALTFDILDGYAPVDGIQEEAVELVELAHLKRFLFVNKGAKRLLTISVFTRNSLEVEGMEGQFVVVVASTAVPSVRTSSFSSLLYKLTELVRVRFSGNFTTEVFRPMTINTHMWIVWLNKRAVFCLELKHEKIVVKWHRME